MAPERPRVRVPYRKVAAPVLPSMPAAAPGGPLRPRANVTEPVGVRSLFPYEAAEWSTTEMGDWLPWIRSPDAEINIFRDRIVSRVRDLTRNDGWACGIILRVLDNTVGAEMRLQAKPDYRALARYGRGYDAVWADEFRRAAEAEWRTYSRDLGRWNDVSRQLTVGQQDRLALRHKLVDGEALIVNHWKPERVGYGAARFATAALVVDPDRLSNPYQMVDTKYLRGGVEIDEDGVPLAYHIRKAHQNDWYNTIESMEWERVEREDDDGWLRVIHDFDRDRAGQNRGVGIFVPVVARLKMLARYYGVELQAATLAASLSTYITSPYDPDMVGEAITGAGSQDELSRYQNLRLDWHHQRPAMFNGAVLPTLAPGESIGQVTGAHPHQEFEPFTHEMLRVVAAATGNSFEQVSQDWSKTNYSSARASLLESWKTLVRRRKEFAAGVQTPRYAMWLREAIERNMLPLPRMALDPVEHITAYAGARWLGPGRGWIDPVKERQGSVLGMDAGLSTLSDECAENSGGDWEENLDQRALERQAMADRNLPFPEWMNGADATEASTPDTPSSPA